jgi:adenylosuccinate lyase
MGAVWSDERRFQRWLDVEIAAMEAWVDAGVVPPEALAAVTAHARVDVDRILEIERRTHHDVLAFTESIAEQVGEPARWFHYGLTSSDVVDTALALQLRDAVGTYANSDPRVEAFALERLELDAEDVATQVIPRDRHARLLSALAEAGASLDRFATEVRHLQRTEVREVLEPFAAGQKGSSAMPHKQNPIVAERVSGLARVLRGNAVVGLENVALWHERDISHSSAERVVLPDSTILLDYMLDRVVWLVNGLTVHPERMLRNLEASHGLVFSGRALLAMVEAGASREAAYAITQRNALRAWDEERDFRGLLASDPEASALLDAAALDRVFDMDNFLRHVDAVFDRALERGEVEHV